MTQQKTTSFDIAYKAGVSQSTVSRALSGSPLVGKETRIKIQAIAKELNYKVDKNASNLRSQKTKTLAVLLFDEAGTDNTMINPFFLTMIGSITQAAAAYQYDVLLSFQQLSDDWYADYEESHRADGVICLGYGDYLTYNEKAHDLIHSNAHFVTWGPVIAGQESCFVGCDNTSSAAQAVDHLFHSGREKVAFIGGADEHCPEFYQRYQGYKTAFSNSKKTLNPRLHVNAQNSEQSGFQAVQSLILTQESFDALFCASDLIAIGAIKALREHNIAIPREVAVIGFDDIPSASYVSPALTTIRQNTVDAGRILVEKILQSIHGEQPESEFLPAQLIIRKSCGTI